MHVLILGAHAQRGLSACLKSHLTSGASVRPENTVTYSAGNGGQNIVRIFSETAPLQRYTAPDIVRHFGKPRIRVSIAREFSRIRARVAPSSIIHI